MKKYLIIPALIAGFALATPMAAFAHAHVASSTPSEGATTRAVRTIALTFDEAMLPPTTTVQLVMTAMPGQTDHDPMEIKNFTKTWSSENRILTLSLNQALRAGTYEVHWQAAGDDGHRMTGTLHFIVS